MLDLKKVQGALMAKKDVKEQQTIYFTTGHTLLDLVVGGGEAIGFGMGYPSGTIVRDTGDTASSKSYKATETVAACYYKYKDKFRWRYCDTEDGNTFDTKELYGFDMFGNQEDYGREVITVEDWDYDINRWLDSLKPDECGVYVLDSLDGITDEAMVARRMKRRAAYEKGKEFDEGTYAMTIQKFLSQEFFRGLTKRLTEKNAILYIISQQRDNVNAGMYGAKNRTSGGRALTFWETVKLLSKRKVLDEVKGRAVSAIIEVKGEKVRHPRPYRSCFVTIHFTYGVDSMSDELDFLFDLRSDKTGELLKRSEKIEWNKGDDPVDRETLIQELSNNPELREELRSRVIQKWEDIEDSIKIVRPPKYGRDA